MSKDTSKDDLACPSAPCAPGATIIGAVGGDGKVNHFKTPMVADTEFIEIAEKHGSPEARFRFSSKCEKGACTQWTGTRCGVADMVTDFMKTPEAPQKAQILPPCVIRGTCRWYAQSGDDICLSCAYVVTDGRVAAAADNC